MAIRVSASKAIAAPPDRVWEIVGDLDREPDFWRGTLAVRNLEVTPEGLRREVTLAFGGRRSEELVRVIPGKSIVHEILQGPMRGRKSVSLRSGDPGTVVEVTWDLRLPGLLRLAEGMVRRHVEEGTRNALERIREAAEGGGPGPGPPS